MAERLLLDACAMIAYLNDEEGADKIEELLWQSNLSEELSGIAKRNITGIPLDKKTTLRHHWK